MCFHYTYERAPLHTEYLMREIGFIDFKLVIQ